ncbi:pre-mRNA-splicing factor sap145-like isoform X1 [Rosa rugosa]|uniref:pre-mRNA-splicing factor sap145-like isoform X1 n=1 Tax=Rosa rugosa TaxID=74645 RepID=UPI002B4010CC|nr:pre-mRNA-splicing factor sap145-like isoform X1 [Rosa rugosa]
MQPKMGKTDIDYQVLHDAFFNYQTMPELTTLGDLYHEGKEFEVKLREMKPELLSYELKEALGMPDGAPPPCLIKYAEIWSPSLYPHLKIPGLNAPIPTGASFGNHVGGCGKPLFKKFFEVLGISIICTGSKLLYSIIDFLLTAFLWFLNTMANHCMATCLVFSNKISLIMRKSQLLLG